MNRINKDNMIEAKDLRIRNLVSTINGYMIVVGITEDGIHFDDGDIYKEKYVEPIQITEEWLIRAGFEEDYKSQWTIKYSHKEHGPIGYDWNISYGWRARYYGNYIKCDYLHQLQNLVHSLTGEELNVNHEGV